MENDSQETWFFKIKEKLDIGEHYSSHTGALDYIADVLAFLALFPTTAFPWEMPWYFCFVCAYASGIILYARRQRNELGKKLLSSTRFVAFLLTVPMAIGMIWTLVLMNLDMAAYDQWSRPISLFLQFFAAMVLGGGYYVRYGKNAAHILFRILCVISFLSFAMGLYYYGFNAVWERVISGGNGVVEVRRYYELHGIGNFMPLYIFYVAIVNRDCERRGLKIAIAALISFLCFKRIALFAAVIICIIALFVHLKDREKGTISFIEVFCQIAIFVGILFWIVLSSTSQFSQIMADMGVQVHGRANIWAYASDQYAGTLFGVGSGAVSIYLTTLISTGVKGLAALLHNDILRVYLEFGSVGAVLWALYNTFWIPARLASKYGYVAKRLYLLVFIYLLISYSTSNSLDSLTLQPLALIIICEGTMMASNYAAETKEDMDIERSDAIEINAISTDDVEEDAYAKVS